MSKCVFSPPAHFRFHRSLILFAAPNKNTERNRSSSTQPLRLHLQPSEAARGRIASAPDVLCLRVSVGLVLKNTLVPRKEQVLRYAAPNNGMLCEEDENVRARFLLPSKKDVGEFFGLSNFALEGRIGE